MSEQQVKEATEAQKQAIASTERFQREYERQQLQLEVPRGRPPETRPHRAFTISEKGKITGVSKPFIPERARETGQSPTIIPVQTRQQKPRGARPQPRPSKRPLFRRPRILGGALLRRTPISAPRLRQGTPANISKAEKDKTLTKLDAQIADWSRKYTFRVVHGGTPQKKNEAAVRLRELMAEREAVEAMRPLGLPEHIRRAENWGS